MIRTSRMHLIILRKRSFAFIESFYSFQVRFNGLFSNQRLPYKSVCILSACGEADQELDHDDVDLDEIPRRVTPMRDGPEMSTEVIVATAYS